jgi:CBS domain-containing protein
MRHVAVAETLPATKRREGVAMNVTGVTHDGIVLETIAVREAMHEGVLSCPKHTPLSTVAELMATRGVHCIVVTDADDLAVWGVISDLDLVAAAGVRDLDAQSAGGSAATPALAIGPGDTLQRAAQMMTEHAVAHLLVVDDASGRPVGVLSTLDIARVLAEHHRR